MRNRITNLTLSCLALSFLAGCITFEPTVDLTKFYILNSQTQASPIARGKTVLLRDVSLADYLENSQIAQRAGSNEIVYLTQHRWAGALDEMIAGVISDEINASHPGFNAAIMQRGDDDLILDVKVLRLDFDPGGELVLNLEYNVMGGGSPETLRHEWLSQRQPIPMNASVAEVVSLMETLIRAAVRDMKLK